MALRRMSNSMSTGATGVNGLDQAATRASASRTAFTRCSMRYSAFRRFFSAASCAGERGGRGSRRAAGTRENRGERRGDANTKDTLAFTAASRSLISCSCSFLDWMRVSRSSVRDATSSGEPDGAVVAPTRSTRGRQNDKMDIHSEMWTRIYTHVARRGRWMCCRDARRVTPSSSVRWAYNATYGDIRINL